MSDYLRTLIARSLNLAEVIDPRPVSLFEPPSKMDFPSTGVLDEIEEEHPSRNIAPPSGDRPRPPAQLGTPSVSRRPEGHHSVDAPRTIIEREILRPAPPPPAPPVQSIAPPPIIVEPAREPAAPSPPPTPPSHPEPTRVTPTLSQDHPRETRPPVGKPLPQAAVSADKSARPFDTDSSANRLSPPPSPLSPPQTPTPGPEVRTVAVPQRQPEEKTLSTTRDSQIAVEHSPPIQPIRIQPHVAPEPAPRSVIEPVATPAPPAVHVTIGRVEIRATPPPSAPRRKERPESTVMTLEEYLRQRENGGPR